MTVDLARDFPRLAATRIALTHDWLTGFGGAERCLEVFAGLFPSAPIFTSIYDSGRFAATFPPDRVRTSALQRFPGAARRYRSLLPLMPTAFRGLDLSDHDLVLASSHAFSKAVRLTPKQRLVCYCYTPIRYLWGERQDEYRQAVPPWQRALAAGVVGPLRNADLAAARRVDQFIAISEEVRGRIQRHYSRDSEVLYPPVFTDRWTPAPNPSRDYFLVVSRFVPYKRVDLAVAACAELGLPLWVVGTGPEGARVRAAAARGGDPSCVTFLGFVPEGELSELYANARALIFTAHEDFGLVPLEANACGTPVIAYAGGGALETVVPGVTGEFFREQTVASLKAVLRGFDGSRYGPAALRAHAMTFDRAPFERRLCELLEAGM
ncbi:MAG TPA: glycosyltransferase [bacterium]|nr:glycosyltransferase [bacterium]